MSFDSPIPAAQYLRKSTEHQQYSLENQEDAIRSYAIDHGFNIVETYSDPGRSGLTLRQRPGLRRLLRDIQTGTIAYKAILVYDVSRWGRFLDMDEAACYEFLCKSAGVPIHYCAETFQNDCSLPSLILKAIKRMMAGEYSRELSVKVYAGTTRVARLGFHVGSTPGYGLRRMLVSANRDKKHILLPKQYKSIKEDHVNLVPGPAQEVKCVREIFRMYTQGCLQPKAIARKLRERGIPFTQGQKRKEWYAEAVNRILHHPKYVGVGVYGQRTQKLHTPSRPIPRKDWIMTPGAWEPIVDAATYAAAQRRSENRPGLKTDEQLLDELRAALKKHGKLSQELLTTCNLHSAIIYVRRFGSVSQAFAKAGYTGSRLARVETRRFRRALCKDLLNQIVLASEQRVSLVKAGNSYRYKTKLKIDDRMVVSVYVCPCLALKHAPRKWLLSRIAREPEHQPLLLVRLEADNKEIMDMYLLSRSRTRTTWTIKEDDPWLASCGIKIRSLGDLASAAAQLKEL